MITGIYSFDISSCVVEAKVNVLNDNAHTIKISSITKFNDHSGEYVEVEHTPRQLEWFERQVAIKLYDMWSN